MHRASNSAILDTSLEGGLHFIDFQTSGLCTETTVTQNWSGNLNSTFCALNHWSRQPTKLRLSRQSGEIPCATWQKPLIALLEYCANFQTSASDWMIQYSRMKTFWRSSRITQWWSLLLQSAWEWQVEHQTPSLRLQLMRLLEVLQELRLLEGSYVTSSPPRSLISIRNISFNKLGICNSSA